ncbi:MAG: effector binding domain-containing protein [Oscillospiraceae bacterium]|nr:effector binding domain-containing protein [Oscillospiraceae bacterium]
MLRIGEAAKQYGISNRTLRYWEDVGVLNSTRAENSYRYYDSENLARINQIVLLRKLKIPIADIERIFIADSYHVTIEILTDYLAHIRHNTAVYGSLATIVENLLGAIKSSQSMEELFLHLETQNEGVDSKHELAPQIQLSERIVVMEQFKSTEKLKNVRIVELPPMTVASYCVESETPEADCASVFDKFVLERNLHKRSGYRSFGFNNPDPSEGNPVYGYELWVTIPEAFDLPEPFVKKQFGGGRYASISAQMNEIGERWEALYEWSTQSERYEGDFSLQWLEEQVMDHETFMSEQVPDSEKQLDLLFPIKLRKQTGVSHMKEHICQSCASPFSHVKPGTNADGTNNQDYCEGCFQNGAFLYPDSTIEKEIEDALPYVVPSEYPDEDTARKALQAFYPTLKRWAT